MADTTVIGTGTQTLAALLICGVLGFVGQGVRAIVGLKNSGSGGSTTPNQQSEFDAAYLLITLMIGFIAGVLAGLMTGLSSFVTGIKLDKILGIVAAGYVGTDFIENALSFLLPKGQPTTAPAADTNIKGPTQRSAEIVSGTSGDDRDLTASAVPQGAMGLLDLIGGAEAPEGYGTLYGNNQGKLAKPLTQMTVAEVIAAGPSTAFP